MDQQVLDIGRTNHKDSYFDLHGQEQQGHAFELDARSKGKSPSTFQNKVFSLVNVACKSK
jgi:hypothetical protein